MAEIIYDDMRRPAGFRCSLGFTHAFDRSPDNGDEFEIPDFLKEGWTPPGGTALSAKKPKQD